jgi:hypothetical protein
MKVIRRTAVRNEAQMSGKPLLLSSDRIDQGVWERKKYFVGGLEAPTHP